MILTCMVITTIWWRGALTCGSCVAINVHSNYYYMCGGEPSGVAKNVHSNYYMVEESPQV